MNRARGRRRRRHRRPHRRRTAVGCPRAQLADGAIDVELLDAGDRLGGKLRTTPFAGLPAVDEGADAFLARVPHASDLAARLGSDRSLDLPGDRGRLRVARPAAPDPRRAAARRARPTCSRSSRSRLLSVARQAARRRSSRCCRARPRRRLDRGVWCAARFGDRGARAPRRPAGRQHLRHRHRPLQPGDGAPARRPRRARAQPAARRPRRPIDGAAATGPVFAAPVAGMRSWSTAAAERATAAGATVVSGRTVHVVAADGAAVARRRRAGRRRGPRHPRRARPLRSSARPPRTSPPASARWTTPTSPSSRSPSTASGRPACARAAATSCPSPTSAW